ncbi:MAG: PIN domain-containing protein [Sphaerochaetaceae bacterium]|nr:PIN domain-containing protein [Sphaerochaetaceae bacterium]
MQIIDANIILRYLMDDHPEQSEEAAKIIAEDVSTTFEVIAEVVYVMESFYDMPRSEITWDLHKLLCDVRVSDRKALMYALGVFNRTSLDFVDCILIGYKNAFGVGISTFDKKLKNSLSRDFEIYQVDESDMMLDAFVPCDED